MRRGVLWAAVAALSALPAVADPPAIPADVFVPTQGEGEYLARDLLLFAKVHNADGQIIGDIEDFILNADNQIVGVVMGTGGFVGLGEKRIAIRLSALQIKHEDGKVTVSLPQATKEVLDALEPFKRTNPPKSLLDRAIERAAEFTDKGSVTAKDAYENKAKPALERAGEAAKDAYERAKEETLPVLEKAGEVAKGAYEGARNALEKQQGEPAADQTAPATEPPSASPPAP
jgi:hypothetical protein